MAYSWDINGIGAGGLPTGVMGFAYLESPGLAYDYQDNDNDGLIDEKRDTCPIKFKNSKSNWVVYSITKNNP